MKPAVTGVSAGFKLHRAGADSTVRRDAENGEDATLFDLLSTENGPRVVASLAARDAGIAIVEAASDDQDRAVIDQAIRVIGEQRGHVSANDVRDLLPGVRPSLIGSRFLAASKRGELTEDGTVRATHAAGHARRLVRWRWVGGA